MSTAPDGLLVIDKPSGWTSHDVVARCRRLCRTRKVGHAGTLDPMATGVLVIGVGRATKLLTFLVGCDKDYDATIRLGQGTVTDDAEGDVTDAPGVQDLERAALEAAVQGLTGEIEQVPSAVSAIKVDGKRSYARVRGGEDVALKPRPVTVSRFDITAVRQGRADDGTPIVDVDASVTVSSGTYVRALARDLGSRLDSAGHLTMLRRTRVGEYGLDRAHDFGALMDMLDDEERDVHALVEPMESVAAGFATRHLDEAEVRTLVYGQPLASEEPGRPAPIAALGPDGRLIAILDESERRARSKVVFPPDQS